MKAGVAALAWPEGWLVSRLESTTSTMDDAKAMAGEAERGCVIADAQTSGRGRLPGRSWRVERGTSLLATFCFPAGEFGDAPAPLVAGLALVRACASWARAVGASFRSPVALKWPNDALCGGRKLAGILCESGGGRLFVGIGVNCSQREFSGEYRTAPTSLAIETGLSPEPEDLAKRLAAAFVELRGGRAWKAEYETVAAYLGETVAFRPGIGDEVVKGILVGVDGDGALMVETESGMRRFHSGELSSC